MDNQIISSEEEVRRFLAELKEVLSNPLFDVKQDLDILLRKRNESPIDPHTTENTLLELDFDSYDLHSQLLALDGCEYMETFIDDKDPGLPPFLRSLGLSKREIST